MPPMKHSYFGASSASRWIHCPASVSMCEKAPRPKMSSFADEGTAAHSLAEMSLISRKMPSEFFGKTIKVNGNEYVVESEMVEAVTVYIMEILKVASPRFNKNIQDMFKIETKFNLDWLGYKGQLFGTCDACIPDTANRALHIFDLKYGAGNPVYADENPQLMYYALGLLGKYATGPDDIEKVFSDAVLHIVQPRCEASGVSNWSISIRDLYTWSQEVLLPAVANALSDNPTFGPSVGACRWCAAKGVCKAYAEQFSIAVQQDIRNTPELVLPSPAQMTAEQIANILKLKNQITGFFDSVYAYAMDMAENGQCLSGYKLVRGRRGNRKWVDERAVVEAFGERLGDRIYEKSILSPAKMEKLLDKKDKALLESFVSREEGKICLVPVSDKRPAVDINFQQSIEDLLGEKAE